MIIRTKSFFNILESVFFVSEMPSTMACHSELVESYKLLSFIITFFSVLFL